MIGAVGKATPATANLIQEGDTQTFTGRPVRTTRSTLTIIAGPQKIELITWFQKGQGPIKQEQRINDMRQVALESIAGKLIGGRCPAAAFPDQARQGCMDRKPLFDVIYRSRWNR